MKAYLVAVILVLSTASSGCTSESDEGYEWPNP